MKIVLANVDYQRHMTSEGEELQLGLLHAGWTLVGAGYADGCRDVPTLLERYNPSHVVVQDKRDWDPESRICFRPDVGFLNLGILSERPDIVKAAVVKDAASSTEYQREFCEEIGAQAAIIYYHPDSVLRHSPWLRGYRLVRTYHSVDSSVLAAIDLTRPRKRAVGSGAVSNSYPLRMMARRKARELGIDWIRHPGYGNQGSRTAAYLEMLAGYRVHLATASKFGFAVRKIMESVAVGCAPVTDLPACDALPEIDGAIIRVPTQVRPHELKEVIDQAVRAWDVDGRIELARLAAAWYDWTAVGRRLSEALTNGT